MFKKCTSRIEISVNFSNPLKIETIDVLEVLNYFLD
jgi:hypothetical protein